MPYISAFTVIISKYNGLQSSFEEVCSVDVPAMVPTMVKLPGQSRSMVQLLPPPSDLNNPLTAVELARSAEVSLKCRQVIMSQQWCHCEIICVAVHGCIFSIHCSAACRCYGGLSGETVVHGVCGALVLASHPACCIMLAHRHSESMSCKISFSPSAAVVMLLRCAVRLCIPSGALAQLKGER